VTTATQQVRIGEGFGGVFINAFMDLPQISAPAVPPAGQYRMYMDVADGRLKALNHAGIITVLGP
jgi:hypothetical protein